MKARIEEVMSRILSEKYDAIIKIRFKERQDEQRRNDIRVDERDSKAKQ